MRLAPVLLLVVSACGFDTFRPTVTQEARQLGGDDDTPTRVPFDYRQLAFGQFDTATTTLTAISGQSFDLPARADGGWLLLMSAKVGSNTTAQNGAALAILVDGDIHHRSTSQATASNSLGSAQMVDCLLADGAPHTVSVAAASPNGSSAHIQNFSLIAVELPASADLHCASDESHGAASDAYATMVATNVTPSDDGDYLVLASAVAQESPGSNGVRMRVRNSDGGFWGNYANQREVLQSFFVARVQTLTVPGTFSIEALGSDGPGSTVTHAHIAAVRLDAFAETLRSETIGVTNVSAGATAPITTLHADARPSDGRRLVIQSMEPTQDCSDPTLLLSPTFRRTENVITAFTHAFYCGSLSTSYGAVSLADATTPLDLTNELTAQGDASTTRAAESVIILLGL
jgi:hypothetical protein